MQTTPLAITALGMVSPVGYDVVTACASLRAGLVRSAELSYQLLDEQSLEMQPISGYPTLLFEGYQGVALLAKLGAHALRDLIRYASVDIHDWNFWRQTGLILCYSTSNDDAADIVDDVVREQLASLVLNQVGLKYPPGVVELIDQGHAGVAVALQRAQRLIDGKQLSRVILAAMDSRVEGASIARLEAENRLKTPIAAAGIMPGEASAAFMVEAIAAAQQRSANIDAYVVNCDVQHGGSYLSGTPPTGEALASALSNALDCVSAQQQTVATIYGDLNGEGLRAQEWGSALIRFKAKHGYTPQHQVFVAESLGDTGAASAAIAVCAACRAYVRRYAKGNLQLIAAVSENGLAGSVLLAGTLR